MPRKSRMSPVVLLVQPNDDSRAMYEEFLAHRGLSPVCPVDAAEALKIAPDADVIVTGLLLPGAVDGYEFIKRLRNDGRTKAKPIVVLTAWAWQTERLRAQDAGCDLFLTKPCLPDELLRHIQKTLAAARRKPARPETLPRKAARRSLPKSSAS